MIIQSLKFEGVGFNYEGHDPLFQNTDIEFPVNSVNVFRGEHGAGRSTILQILAGLQSPTQGKYYLNGLDVTEMSFEDFLPFRLKMGYGFDMGGLISNRTIYENLILPLVYHNLCSKEEAHDRVMFYIDRYHLNKQKNERPAHVSGGVRKATCIIRALITEPEVLFLDDPTIGLTKDMAQILGDSIQRHMKDHGLHTVFISSYDEKFIALFEHQLLYLESGQIYRSPDSEKKVVSL